MILYYNIGSIKNSCKNLPTITWTKRRCSNLNGTYTDETRRVLKNGCLIGIYINYDRLHEDGDNFGDSCRGFGA